MLNELDASSATSVAAQLRAKYALPATGDNIRVAHTDNQMVVTPVVGGVPLMGTTPATVNYQRTDIGNLDDRWGVSRVPVGVYATPADFIAAFHTCNAIVLEPDDLGVAFPFSVIEGNTDLPMGASSLRFFGTLVVRGYIPATAKYVFTVTATAKAAGTKFYLGNVAGLPDLNTETFTATVGNYPITVTFESWTTGWYKVCCVSTVAIPAGDIEVTVTTTVPFGTGCMKDGTATDPILYNNLTFPISTITEITQNGFVNSSMGFVNPTKGGAAIWVESTVFAKNKTALDISSLFANPNIGGFAPGVFDNQRIIKATRAFQTLGAPSLPAGMFSNATLSGAWDYAFKGSALSVIDAGCFPSQTAITTMKSAFKGCTGLVEIPSDLFEHAQATLTTLFECFYQTGIVTVPAGLFDGLSLVTDFGYVFASSKIETLPTGLFDNCSSVVSFQYSFSSTPLTTIPSGLFDHSPNVTSINGIFSNSQITGIPEGLFNAFTKLVVATYCFMNCSRMVTVPDELFKNCTLINTLEFAFYGATAVNPFPLKILDGLNNLISLRSAFELCGRFATPVEFPASIMAGKTKLTNGARVFLGGPFNGVEEGAFDDLVACVGLSYFWGGASWSASGAPLEYVPATLFSKCVAVTDISGIFAFSKLQSIPATLFSNLPHPEKLTAISGLFYGCSVLPELPGNLFTGCTGVTAIDNIFAKSTLTDIPDNLFTPFASSVVSAVSAFQETKLTRVKRTYLEGFKALTDCSSMFSGVATLTTVEGTAFKDCTAVTTANNLFLNCTSLTAIPDEDLIPSTALLRVSGILRGCNALSTIYGKMFNSALAIADASFAFSDSGVTECPSGLFANKSSVGNLTSLFYGAVNLTNIRAGWLTTPTPTATITLTAAFAQTNAAITAEAGSIPVTVNTNLTSLFGSGTTSTGVGAGIAGEINRLDAAFVLQNGVAPRTYTGMFARYPSTTQANTTLTGTANAILTALGLTQSALTTAFGSGSTVTWQ